MSLNTTPLTEIHRTVLNTTLVAVSSADLISGFPILAPDGTLAAPVYSFTSNPDSGLARTSDGVSAVVDTEVGLVAGGDGNAAIGATPSSYGSGEGVVFLADAAVNPVGIPNAGAGGILYVDGADLNYLDSAGSTITLSSAGLSNVVGPGSSLDDQLVRFASTTGGMVQTSGVTYTSSQLLCADGAAAAPAYAFSTDTGAGLSLSGTSLQFATADTTRLSLDATISTLTVPMASGDGLVGAPAFSFTSDPTSGLFYASNHVQVSSGGVAGLAVGGSSTRNVSLTGGPGTYGTGADGVVFIPTATTDPVGIPNGGSGGVLYVTAAGAQLRWLNASGTSIRLGGSVASLGSSIDNEMVVWGNTTGTSLAARAALTDAGEVRATQSVTLTNPAYSFTGDTTTGMVLADTGMVRFLGAGTGALTVGSVTTASVPMTLPKLAPTTPAIQFNPTTGLFSELADQMGVVVNGDPVMAARASSNVAIGTAVGGFGSGQGVVELVDATTNPSSAPSDGGFLYVDGTSLLFRDTANIAHDLTATANVASVGSSTDTAVVRFDSTTGKVVQDTSAILVSDAGQVASTLGYTFVSSATSGLTSGGADTLSLSSAGTTSLTASASGLTVASSHVVAGVDGSAGTPAFSFSSDPDTGVYRSGTNEVSLSTGGVRALTLAPNSNVSLGRDAPDFAGGQGVVNFSDVATAPVGVLSQGGLLYVSGRDMFFHDQTGTFQKITGVGGDSSSTDNLVVSMTSDTTGRHIESVSGFSISDTNQFTGLNGSSTTPAYRVTGDTGWWHAGSDVLELGDGAAQLAVSSTAVVSSVQLEVASTARIGGSAGMTETFGGNGTTRTMGNASGTFIFEQNGTAIMQTDASRDVDMLSNFVNVTGATGDLLIGYTVNGAEIDAVDGADSIVGSVGGTAIMTLTETAVTVTNLALGEAHMNSTQYVFTSSPTSGIVQDGSIDIKASGVAGVEVASGGRMSLCGGSIGSGNRYCTIGTVVTAPTSLPTEGVYLYVDNSTFMRVTNKDVDVAVNGPYARAKVSRTQTIATGALDLVDTLTDTESSVLVVDTGAPGAGTITGTADTAGFWEICAEAHWAFHATGYRHILIKVGGVVVGESIQNAVTVSSVETQQQARACVNVAASAVVTFEVFQNSGGNLNVDVVGSVVFLG